MSEIKLSLCWWSEAAGELSAVLKRHLKRAVLLEVYSCKVPTTFTGAVSGVCRAVANLWCHKMHQYLGKKKGWFRLIKLKKRNLKDYLQHTRIAFWSEEVAPCPAQCTQKQTRNAPTPAWWCTQVQLCILQGVHARRVNGFLFCKPKPSNTIQILTPVFFKACHANLKDPPCEFKRHKVQHVVCKLQTKRDIEE